MNKNQFFYLIYNVNILKKNNNNYANTKQRFGKI